jgi:hypothetical protein
MRASVTAMAGCGSSNPVVPTFLQFEPFGENVERLSLLLGNDL